MYVYYLASLIEDSHINTVYSKYRTEIYYRVTNDSDTYNNNNTVTVLTMLNITQDHSQNGGSINKYKTVQASSHSIASSIPTIMSHMIILLAHRLH